MLVESKKNKKAIRKNPLGRPKVTCTSPSNGGAKIQINPNSAIANLQSTRCSHFSFIIALTMLKSVKFINCIVCIVLKFVERNMLIRKLGHNIVII